MKRIAVLSVLLTAAVGMVYVANPSEFARYVELSRNAAVHVWDGVEANPFPMILALGTFVLTVIYHKAKGKSLRESVEAAATRVTVIAAPVKDESNENGVVVRAKARATRTQLLADKTGLQNRHRKLPEEIQKAEKDACYTEQALADAKRSLADKQKAHEQAVAKLEVLQKEKATGDAELAEIEAGLKKLADLV